MELLFHKSASSEYSYYRTPEGNQPLHGEYKGYYITGEIYVKVFYYHGRRHGEYITWNARGDITGRGFYMKDVLYPYIEMTSQEKLLFQIQHPGFRFIETE